MLRLVKRTKQNARPALSHPSARSPVRREEDKKKGGPSSKCHTRPHRTIPPEKRHTRRGACLCRRHSPFLHIIRPAYARASSAAMLAKLSTGRGSKTASMATVSTTTTGSGRRSAPAAAAAARGEADAIRGRRGPALTATTGLILMRPHATGDAHAESSKTAE